MRNILQSATKKIGTGYHHGFSLIELMIVIAIMGILAIIAIPSYQTYIVKAKLTNVVSDLQAASVLAEVSYQANGTFTGYSGSTTSLSPYTASLGWNPGSSGGTQLQLIAQVQNVNSAVNGYFLYLILSADTYGNITACCGTKNSYTAFPVQYFPPGCNSTCTFSG